METLWTLRAEGLCPTRLRRYQSNIANLSLYPLPDETRHYSRDGCRGHKGPRPTKVEEAAPRRSRRLHEAGVQLLHVACAAPLHRAR